mgnify:CR=1 FL=1
MDFLKSMRKIAKFSKKDMQAFSSNSAGASSSSSSSSAVDFFAAKPESSPKPKAVEKKHEDLENLEEDAEMSGARALQLRSP